MRVFKKPYERSKSITHKYKVFVRQNGLCLFIYFLLRKLFFIFYKHLFRKCGSIFIAGSFRISGKQSIEIGKLFAGRRITIDAITHFYDKMYSPEILIGRNVSFGDDVHIACTNNIRIGDNVLFGSHIYMTDHDHGIYSGDSVKHSSPTEPPSSRKLTDKGFVIIGDNVHVGEYVCIMKNVQIGKGSIIGAQSVVTRNIPEYSIAVGNPAKVIKKFDFQNHVWISTDNGVS